MKVKILQYAIALGVGIAIAVTIALLLNSFSYAGAENQSATQILMRSFSDGFFATGVLLFCVGALVWLSNMGIFDIFTYSGRSIAKFFFPMSGIQKKNYYDYKVEKAEKPKKTFSFLLVSGAGLLVVGIVFSILFNVV